MRRLLSIGIIVLFIGLIVNPISGINLDKQSFKSISNGNTLYVGGSGPNNYTSIQSAIDNASNGDTVYVYNESSPYYEHIDIYVSINLVGEDRESTIIDGSSIGDVVSIYADWVTISNFKIQNSGKEDDDDTGIYINSNYNIISDNNLTKNYFGLSLFKSNCNSIVDNVFWVNRRGGINLIKSRRNNITRNDIIGNWDWGIFIHGRSHFNIVTYNLILDNYFGISIQDSLFNIIRSNNVRSNFIYGVDLYFSWFNNIQGNIISNSYNWGISIDSSKFNTIKGNTLKLNREFGILIVTALPQPDFNIIIKNNIFENKIDAYFAGSSGNRWIRNYWNDTQILPKRIPGILFYTLEGDVPWYNFDWFPARKPYDIEV